MSAFHSPALRLLAVTAVALATALAGGCGSKARKPPAAAQAIPAAAPRPAPAAAAYWKPSTMDSWQIQLQGPINTSHEASVYIVDLFDASQETIDRLHGLGRRVICYFSAGTAEDWRSDLSQFQNADLGRTLKNWPGERWVDTRSARVRAVMTARLDLALRKRCDGVDPDNLMAFEEKTGLPLTADTQLDYNRFIAREARNRRLAVGLKNDTAQVADLAGDFDFAVNEECHEQRECEEYAPFLAAGKPVLNIEYRATWARQAAERAKMCSATAGRGLRTLVLPKALDDSFRHACPAQP